MVEKSVSATTSGNTVVAKLRTLAPGEVVSGGYFKGFERTDEYVQMISSGREGVCWALLYLRGRSRIPFCFYRFLWKCC